MGLAGMIQWSLAGWSHGPWQGGPMGLAGMIQQSLPGWPHDSCQCDTLVLVRGSPQHAPSPGAVTHPLSPAGPVGFQSNNVPLAAGMFTSIGASTHCAGRRLGPRGCPASGTGARLSVPLRGRVRPHRSGVSRGARDSPGAFPGPQSPATTGTASSGSASRTSPLWWRRRPR